MLSRIVPDPIMRRIIAAVEEVYQNRYGEVRTTVRDGRIDLHTVKNERFDLPSEAKPKVTK